MKSKLMSFCLLFFFFQGLSQVDTVHLNLDVNYNPKVTFSLFPLIDLEGMMIQAGVEYPVSEKLALKHLAAYYLNTDEQRDPGKMNGFRLGTTLKVYFQKPNKWRSPYLGITTLWKRAVFEGIRFLPQENSYVWKRAEFSNIYNILGLYANFGLANKSGNHFFTDFGLMVGPEYVHSKWIDVPEGTSNMPPHVPQPDLFYYSYGPGGDWRFMVRFIADIGYNF